MSDLFNAIVEGCDVRQAIKENSSDTISLDRAKEMVADWLSFNTYGYKIKSVEPLGVKVEVIDYGPDGQTGDDEYFVVKPDGRLYNSAGGDVVATSLDAYDNDPEIQKEIKAFVSRWY